MLETLQYRPAAKIRRTEAKQRKKYHLSTNGGCGENLHQSYGTRKHKALKTGRKPTLNALTT